MNNPPDVSYAHMLVRFRVNDLKRLLEAFGQSIEGQRTELRERALELLRSRPVGLNYLAYQSKIFEIYGQILTPPQRMDQLSQYPQQSEHTTRARLPQSVAKIEGLIRGNLRGANTFPGNNMANNHIQYVSGSYRPVGPHTVVPSQFPTYQQNPPNSGNSNAFASIPSPQIVANYKFKKLPFYDVIEGITKPIPLDGSDRCTLSNFPKGMRECIFKYTMTNEQIALLGMNRDTSHGKHDYPFNCQIRICQLDQVVGNEVTDKLPMGLYVRINRNVCPLPPTANKARPGPESRRTAGPINCAHILKLNPIAPNVITINWIPDGKIYALAMYIVKQLSVDTLVKNLQDNKVRSSEETKNDIIKKMTVVDPDLASTSHKFSLICPLSTVRMKIPAKSIHCDHLQCFDAGTFILMNEKRPKWVCPTCHKSCLYDEIRIDGYFLEIVESLALRDDIKEISILDDGSCIIPEEIKDTKNMNSNIDNEVIDLDDYSESTESKKEPRPGGSKCQKHENSKQYVVDLSIDEEEEPTKQKDKPDNLA